MNATETGRISERRQAADRRSGDERRRILGLDTADAPGAELPLAPATCAHELRQLANLEMSESDAVRHWRAIEKLRAAIRERLHRDVGLAVATLDYFLNATGELLQPTIVERSMLEAVERRAITDPLTGLFNRQHFSVTLQRELERAARHGTCLSLALFDVDGLKQVNDRHGHLVGDEALRRVGAAIRRDLRGVDVPCRFGGDEFALILPDADLAGAEHVVARVRADCVTTFKNAPLAATPPVGVTVSGGAGTCPLGGTPDTELLSAADRALYLAKRGLP